MQSGRSIDEQDFADREESGAVAPRWFYTTMHKMFGKDLTPVKQQMHLPGMVWGSIAMEAGLGRKRKMSLRFIQLAKVRTAARVGCPF